MSRQEIEDQKKVKKFEKEISRLLTVSEMYQDEVVRHLVYRGVDRKQAQELVEKVALDLEQKEGKYAWAYIMGGVLIMAFAGVLMVLMLNEGVVELKVILIAVAGGLMFFKGIYARMES